jgi:hypothetical protein
LIFKELRLVREMCSPRRSIHREQEALSGARKLKLRPKKEPVG